MATPAEGAVAMPPSDEKCVICFDAAGDHVMVPCGHGGYCGACAKEMCTGRSAPHDATAGHLCPVCRAPVEKVARVYLGTALGYWCNARCALVVAPPLSGRPPT